MLDSIDSSFGHWLAGFTDGEGAFMLLRTSSKANPHWRPWTIPRFSIGLRADDVAVLEMIRATLGIGVVHTKKRAVLRANEKPSVSFDVWRIQECLQLVDLFTRFPLRAKKAHQFEIWAQGIREIARGAVRDLDVLDTCRAELAALRIYDHAVIDGWVPTMRTELRHGTDYGDPPLCLCGCDGPVKPHGGRGVPHPENQAYARFLRGHHMRTPQSRARIRLAFRGY